MSNPGLPRKSSELSAASFDDIPEARRESVDPPRQRLRLPPVWLALAAIAIGGLGLGLWGISRLSRNSIATGGVSRTKPTNGAVTQATPGADGRLLNHYPYSETAQGNLDAITSDGTFKLHYKAAKAYKEMVAAAQADGVSIVPLSAFRSVKDQQELFLK